MTDSFENYDDCMREGIAGGCGPDCHLYINGECDEPEGIEETNCPKEDHKKWREEDKRIRDLEYDRTSRENGWNPLDWERR